MNPSLVKRNSNGAIHAYAALDGLRGLLALSVALIHFPIYANFPGTPDYNGPIAVDFFFLLSGFVISHSLRGGLDSGSGILRFALRRVGRIWPLHLAMLAVLVLVHGQNSLILLFGQSDDPLPFASAAHGLWTLMLNIFMLQAFQPLATWNHPSWSVGAEFWTYLVFAGIVFICRQRTLAISAAIILTALAVQVAMGYDPGLFYISRALHCVVGFFLGHLVYSFLQKSRTAHEWEGTCEVLGMVLLCGLILFTKTHSLALAAPFLLTITLWIFAKEQGPLSAFLKKPRLQRLGELSYGIYMVHLPVIVVFNHWLALIHRGATKLVGSECPVKEGSAIFAEKCGGIDLALLVLVLALYFGIVLLAAKLAFRYVENPFKAKFSQWAFKVKI